MKLSTGSLIRKIISEEITKATNRSRAQAPRSGRGVSVPNDARPKMRQPLGGVFDLKKFDSQAFNAWIRYLIEDCDDQFVLLGDGRIEVKAADGRVYVWDPQYSMGEWEPTR